MSSEEKQEKNDLADALSHVVTRAIVPAALSVSLLTAGTGIPVPGTENATPPASVSELTDSGSDDDSDDAEVSQEGESEQAGVSYAYGRLAAGSAVSAAASAGAGALLSRLGELAKSIFSEFIGAAASGALEVLAVFVCLLTLFGALYKAVYPDRSLKEFFKPKNIGRILLGSVLCFAAYRFVCSLDSGAPIWGIVLVNLFTLALVLFLWYRTFALTGKFSVVLKRLFWGKRGKLLLFVLLALNLATSAVRILYSGGLSGDTLNAVMFYVVCFIAVIIIYALCACRMVEE